MKLSIILLALSVALLVTGIFLDGLIGVAIVFVANALSLTVVVRETRHIRQLDREAAEPEEAEQ